MKKEKTDLLAYIREGKEMTREEKMKLIVQLSIPSILAQLSSIMMFFIDAAMVGSLGARQSAAIGLIESTTWLFGGLTSAASMGFSVQAAHFIGANDFENARHVLRQALVCCAIFSSALMLVAVGIHTQLPFWLGGGADIARESSLYFLVFSFAIPLLQLQGLAGSMLKCSGNMKVPSMLNVMMCLLDVGLNYVFIFVMQLGVLGAALGTFCAILVTAIAMLYFLIFRSSMLSLRRRPGSFKPTYATIKAAFSIGAPMGFQHTLMGGAQIVSTMIVAPLGNIAIAANSFAITVESICYMPGYGIAEAATTLVGQAIGAGKKALTRAFAFMSVGLGMLTMTLMGLLMFIFAPELMAIMTPVEAIREIGAQSLRIEAFAEPMFAAAIVANGVFIGAGDTLRPAMMSLASIWAVRLSLAALLAPRFGLPGVWTAMAIELTFRGAIFLIRLFRGNWDRNIKDKA
jgi:putative MATE family efflux protein